MSTLATRPTPRAEVVQTVRKMKTGVIYETLAGSWVMRFGYGTRLCCLGWPGPYPTTPKECPGPYLRLPTGTVFTITQTEAKP